eukprot:307128-Hanusia_phi.AAC.2
MAVVFLAVSAAMTFLSSVRYLVVAKGAGLCCAASDCGKVLIVQMILALSIFSLIVSVPLYSWMLWHLLKDIFRCRTCLSAAIPTYELQAACAAKLSIETEFTGLSSAAGSVSVIAILSAARYCYLVPAAIHEAMAYKAHSLMYANQQFARIGF